MATVLHEQIKTAVVNKIRGLALKDTGGAVVQVYDHMLPDNTNVEYPCVICSEDGEAEVIQSGDTTSFEVQYGLRVFIADRQSTKSHELKEMYKNWRRNIWGVLHQKKLESVPQVFSVYAIPNLIFDPNLWQYQMMISGMRVVASAWEARNSYG